MDPNNIHGILQDRLLLGTPRNNCEPTLNGCNHCKYGKSILENAKFCQILKTKTLNKSYRPKQYSWILAG